MPNNLIKFVNKTDGNGRGNLFWGRADIDGLPFRGKEAPLLRTEEFEDRLVRVADPKNATFYTGDEEQNIKYLRQLFKCGGSGVLISSIVFHFLPDLDPLPVRGRAPTEA